MLKDDYGEASQESRFGGPGFDITRHVDTRFTFRSIDNRCHEGRVDHFSIFHVELARSFERKAGIRVSERALAGAEEQRGEQRGQEVRQSGKKAGERVLGFVEVGGKSGSGGERKVSFRSRRSLARTLARVAEASHRQSSTRFRGVAVSDDIIPRISGAAYFDPRDFSPPADARTSDGACSHGKGLFFLDDDVGTETPWIGSFNRAGRKEEKKEKAENEEKARISSGVVTSTGLFISRENGTPCRAMPRRQRARDVNEFDDAHYGMPELAFHNTYISSLQRRSP
ncbi:hypothetical protein G5I_14255 [Acromyrmex echinatior]|uniref:Uncharacterized protein n=1 Tax=Acromyrmex echinatior TaxID=103372 RepID=F4X7B5_ACREC|nr:hypothetical protein G5I_14255 [Acromyrmex echinatior]